MSGKPTSFATAIVTQYNFVLNWTWCQGRRNSGRAGGSKS